MSKGLKKISVMMVLALLISASASLSAFAADEKRLDIGGSNGSYITVSNVVDEKTVGVFPLYIANGTTTVQYNGDGLDTESILFLPKAQFQNGKFTRGISSEPVNFEVKKYMNNDNDKVFDELTEGQPFEETPHHYVTDNYATLSKPGYYFVRGTSVNGNIKDLYIEISGDSTVENNPSTVSAAPTASKVLVNGKVVSFEAYNIDGNNYFKLRDLAMALNGSDKNFEVGYDSKNNAISLTSKKAYTPAGGELAVSAKVAAKDALTTTSKVFLDGKEVKFTAYNIDGNNYFKLRDITKALNIGVTFDSKTGTIGIDTKSDYKE